ncbi:MAG: HYR domain-containing protein [Saprospiraceae bacterium]|nr:HYR domain-containing protein [Saprospiraceae bacterium]
MDKEVPVIPCANVVFGSLVGPFGNTLDLCALNTAVLIGPVTDNCDTDINLFALINNPDHTINTLPFPLVGGNVYQSGLYTFQVGISTLTFYATDDAGNTSSCIYQIEVEDTQLPEITCPSGSPFNRANTPGACGYTAAGNEFDATGNDNCAAYTLTHNYYNWSNLSSLNGAVFPVGTTNVIWTITDASGNSASCSVQIIVTDQEAPVANCQPNLDAVLDGDGAYQIVTTMLELGSTDNCGLTGYAISRDGVNFGPSFSVGCLDIDPDFGNVVNGILRVTDASGNTATCTTQINVLDLTRPVAICQDVTVYLDANGEAGITTADIDAGSYDNCGILSLVLSQTDFDCDNTGNNNVTLTVTDAVGNTGICVATVTVRDTIRPTFTCPEDVIALSCYDVVPDLVSLVEDAADNCGVLSITQNPVAGEVIGLTDGSGISGYGQCDRYQRQYSDLWSDSTDQ